MGPAATGPAAAAAAAGAGGWLPDATAGAPMSDAKLALPPAIILPCSWCRFLCLCFLCLCSEADPEAGFPLDMLASPPSSTRWRCFLDFSFLALGGLGSGPSGGYPWVRPAVDCTLAGPDPN